MARYQLPQDPRKQKSAKTNHLGEEAKEPIPWHWFGLGLLVTIIGIGLAMGLINSFLSREPLPVTPLSPTLIVLTAPATVVATPTPRMPTPTIIPTLTPIPTPDVAVAPDEITVGFYAKVANTEGFGVTIRGGPSTNNVAITVAEEDTILFALDGPVEGNGYLWWQIRLSNGIEGWAAADFLVPSAAPDN